EVSIRPVRASKGSVSCSVRLFCDPLLQVFLCLIHRHPTVILSQRHPKNAKMTQNVGGFLPHSTSFGLFCQI
ncbi:MAG: hypothetical protein ACI9KK_001315, partial [Ascidiaceihabitans sp.]